MKYTKQQLNDMQEYLLRKINMISINHNFPKEERTLNLLLVMIADQRIDTETVQNTQFHGGKS